MKIYYAVQSGGDGSVSVTFYDSEELADIAEEVESNIEGWGESSVSWLEIESDSPITSKKVITAEKFFAEMEKEGDDYGYGYLSKDQIEEFKAKVKKLL